MNLPTKITTARIVLIVLTLLALGVLAILANVNGLLVGSYVGSTGINWVYLAVLIVFVIAASTDALDGYLARGRNEVTDLGKFLDPIADKMLVNSMLILLCVPCVWSPNQETIPVACVIVMVIRDLVVDAIRQMAAKKKVVLAANIFGKLKTVFQMVAIPAVLLNDWPFSYFAASWNPYLKPSMLLVYLATAMSVVSGIIYVVQNAYVLKESNAK